MATKSRQRPGPVVVGSHEPSATSLTETGSRAGATPLAPSYSDAQLGQRGAALRLLRWW